MGLLAGAFFKGKGQVVQDVGTMVQTFDFSKMAGNDYLHCDLAPALGKLDKATLKEMEDVLRIMISGVMMQLINVRERSWEDVVAIMEHNMLLERKDDILARAEKLSKEGTEEFKSDGTARGDIVREVQTWFTNLIRDEDVLVSTKIDAEVLGKIAAQAGDAIRNFESSFKRDEYHEKTVLDIRVLRFPDLEQPDFKLYRIKLAAWLDSRRILAHDLDKSGITGEYECRKFKPRRPVIEGMPPSSFHKALAMADDLFD